MIGPGPPRFDRAGEPGSRPAPPRLASPAAKPPLRPAQHSCYRTLSLALQEGNVFAALTGPAGSGKTAVLDAVLADRQDRATRLIRIDDPGRVSASLAALIEQVAEAEAARPENQERQPLFAIDDAQAASDDLLRCLGHLARIRATGRRVPQVLLVGRPKLWARLSAAEYEGFARQVAIRAVLPEPGNDIDPWAVVERDMVQALSDGRGGPELLPPDPAPTGEAGHGGRAAGFQQPPLGEAALPPDLYALFPDVPLQRAGKRPAGNGWSKWLILPAAALMVAAATLLLFKEQLLPGVRPTPAYRTAIHAPASMPATSERRPTNPQPPAPLPAPPPAPAAAAPPPAPQPPPPAAAVAAPAPAPVPAPEPATPKPPPRPARPPVPPEIVETLVRRGTEQAGLGDISAARSLFERAAEAGNAAAALRLARTYDAAFLPQADAPTLADPASAQLWYGRAAALGSKEAAERLQTLNRTR